jgi:hypothetical protein
MNTSPSLSTGVSLDLHHPTPRSFLETPSTCDGIYSLPLDDESYPEEHIDSCGGRMNSAPERQTAQKIIQVLTQEPLTPKEVVARLADQQQEVVVRDLLGDLLDQGRLAVTQDRKLRAVR